MKRVGILKFWAMGDVVMATPLLHALKAAHPDVHITWVVDKMFGEVLRGHPLLDELLVWDTGEWRRLRRRGRVLAWAKRTRELRDELATRNFDALINCHAENWWSPLLCPAGPVRVGLYPGPDARPFGRFYTHAVTRPPGVHNISHYLLATQALGVPDAGYRTSIGTTPDEAPFLAEFFASRGMRENDPLVVVAPFSTGENRCWEPERYAALMSRLYRDHGAQGVVTFAPGDAERARTLARGTDVPLHLADGTTLRQYIALLRRADLVVCVDSSAMHLAAAVGTPYVALFGPTPVRERAPLAGRGLPMARIEGLDCAPCDRTTCTHPVYRACMKALTLDEVYAASARFLAAVPRVSAPDGATIRHTDPAATRIEP